MNLGIEGTHVLIAGSSRGIGLEIAREFKTEGAKVWLSGRSADTLSSAKAELGEVSQTVCDLTSSIGRKALVEQVYSSWKKLDTLVLSLGGLAPSKPGLDCSDEEWIQLFQLNFFAQVALIRDFKKLLSQSSQASIIAISSIAGETRLAAPLAYSTSKAALNHFNSAATSALAELGIRLNIVSPGNILFPGGRWEQRVKDNPEAVQKMLDTTVPLKRFGTPHEIANAVVFLASKRASFCTGSLMRVDGGQVPS